VPIVIVHAAAVVIIIISSSIINFVAGMRKNTQLEDMSVFIFHL
jgi:hypothetical protein